MAFHSGSGWRASEDILATEEDIYWGNRNQLDMLMHATAGVNVRSLENPLRACGEMAFDLC